jgi:hypothetical protein
VVGNGLEGIEANFYLYSNGYYTELPRPLGYNNTMIRGLDLNDNGDLLVQLALGGSRYGYGPIKSFIYTNDNYTEILPPGLEYFEATAINNNGDVIGDGYDMEVGYGKNYLYTSGKFMELPQPALWSFFQPIDINDYGEITGSFVNLNGVYKGFIAIPK